MESTKLKYEDLVFLNELLKTGLSFKNSLELLTNKTNEKIIDEKLFLETLWEIPYQVLREGEEYIGYYAELPGCIGSAANEEELKTEMQAILKKWIRTAVGIWRENKILEE